MPNVPSNIYSAVEPYAQQYGVPDALWEALAFDESGYDPSAVGDYGTSFGLFQLHNGGQANAAYAAGYSQQDLLNPGINAKFGMPAIGRAWSNLKGSFNNSLDWWLQFFAQSGHPGGSPSDPVTQAYEKHFFNVTSQASFQGLGTGTGSTGIGNNGANMQAFAWARFPITHGYIPSYNANEWDTPHYAVDLATPFHTVVTALLTGTVIQADYAVWNGLPGGGEVFIKADSGPTYYYYHFDVIQVHQGDRVYAGSTIGLSGGQNSGGSHPVASAYSSGAHLHVGYFTKYISTPIGTEPYGPDITPLIQQVATSGTPLVTGGGSTGSRGLPTGFTSFMGKVTGVPSGLTSILNEASSTAQNTLNSVPGFLGICLALDQAETFPGLVVCATDPANNDFSIFGIDTHIPNPAAVVTNDFNDAFCTIFSTITGNALPFFLRSLFIMAGALLVIGLIVSVASKSETVKGVVSLAGAAA